MAVKQVCWFSPSETWPSAWPVKALFTPQFITFKSCQAYTQEHLLNVTLY